MLASSFTQKLLGFQIFHCLVFDDTLHGGVGLVHFTCYFDRVVFDCFDSFGVVNRIIELLGVGKVGEIDTYYVEETKDASEDEADPPKDVCDFSISMLFGPEMLILPQSRKRRLITMIMYIINHFVNTYSF